MTIWTRTFVLATMVNFQVSLVFFILIVSLATSASGRSRRCRQLGQRGGCTQA